MDAFQNVTTTNTSATEGERETTVGDHPKGDYGPRRPGPTTERRPRPLFIDALQKNGPSPRDPLPGNHADRKKPP